MAIAFTSSGVGLSANITAVASAANQLWGKGIIKVDAIRSLGNGFGMGLFQIDADGAGTNKKWQGYILGNDTTHFQVFSNNPGNGGVNTPSVLRTGLPANGNYVIWYLGWDQTNFTYTVQLTDVTGTVVTDGSASAVASTGGNIGALSTTGGANGRVTINNSFTQGSVACTHGGAAFYTGQPPAPGATLRYAAPASGDSNIVAMWKMNDATSGTSPSTAAATVGSQGLVLTTGQYAYASSIAGTWFPGQVPTTATCTPSTALIAGGATQQFTGTILDASSQPITGEPVTWTSDNHAVGTVDSSGLATGVGPGTCNIKVADTSDGTVNATSVLTVETAGTLALSSTGKGLSGLVTGLANLQTTASIKWVQKVDSLRTLGAALAVSSSAVGCLDADGADTSHKCCFGWSVRANGNLALKIHIFGFGDIEGPNAIYTNLTANGTYVICELDVVNGTQHFNVCQADGSTVIAAFSGTTTATPGTNAFPTSGSPGRFTLNKDNSGSSFLQKASVYAGLAFYNTVLSGANRFSAPINTDTGLQAGWYMADAATGSTPASAAAFAGGQALVLTNNTWDGDLSLWAPSAGQVPTTATVSPTAATLSPGGTTQLTGTILDGSTNPITGEPVTWSSDTTGVATVDGTGLVTAVAVGSANITVTDNANGAVSATAAITVTGIGTLSLSSTGSGLSANVPGAASINSTMSLKWVQKTDGLRAAGASKKMPIAASDQDGGGTNAKWAIGWVTDGSGNIGLAIHVPLLGGPSGPVVAQTTLPANGNYVICEVDCANNSQNFNVYTAAGSQIAGLSAHATYNLGATNWGVTPGANGRISLNRDPGGYFTDQTAHVYGGMALYSSTLTGGGLLSAPSAGDSGIVAGWLMNDNTTGSTPSTAAAFAGGQALVLTNNTWTSNASAWTAAQVPTTATVSPTSSSITSIQTLQLTGQILDASATLISGEPVTWTTSNPAVATVNSTGLVSAVAAGVCTITVADASVGAVSATSTITVTTAAATTATLTCIAYATSDSSQPIAGKIPTWTTSNAAIAVVDSTGTVAGVAAGTCTITGQIDGKTDTCAVTVS